MGASIRRSPSFCCPGRAPAQPLGASMRPRHMLRSQSFAADASHLSARAAQAVPTTLAFAPSPRLASPGKQPTRPLPTVAPPPASFASYAWAVGRWLHALAASPASELMQFHTLRALVPVVRQAHAALANMHDLTDVQGWVSRIETDLTCPLHQGLMQQPGALGCGHIFETAWLRCLPAQEDGTVHCPTCRA